jgi:SnoaL-like domain
MEDVAAAKLAITEVIYSYCRAVDRMDRALAATLFHPGATADYGPTFRGSAEGLIENLWANHAKLLGHSHQVTNILIEVDGDRAGSESYAHGTLWSATDDGVLVVLTALGRYIDRWSRRDGRWAIDDRRFVYDLVYSSTPAVAPEAGENVLARLAAGRDPRQTAGRRDRTDPSYDLMGAPAEGAPADA